MGWLSMEARCQREGRVRLMVVHVLAKIAASFTNAFRLSLLKKGGGAIGTGGEGWERAVMRSWTAAMNQSLDDVISITRYVGNQASVLIIRSTLVFHTHTQ